jgi:predicted kinase
MAGTDRPQDAAHAQSLYDPATTRRVYDRLAELADPVLGAGWPVIVDAACLRRSERDRFRALAAGRHSPFRLVHCEAPVEVMRARLARRALAGDDPSEATQAVLVRQLAAQELLAPDEPHATVGDDPACDAVADAIECLARERR